MNQELQQIMLDYPALTAYGHCDDLFLFRWSRAYTKDAAAFFASERDALAERDEQYDAAKRWIATNMVRRKNFNRRQTSYGLKHICELATGYMPNGVFIAAMLGSGFRIATVEGSPNVFFDANLRREVQR